jgi:hypothetical protein
MTSETTGPERETVPPAPRGPAEPVEPVPSRPSGGSRLLTPAVAGSVVVLLVSAATSIGWVVANGGVALPPRATAPALAGASNPAGSASPGQAPGESGAPGSSPVAAVPTGPAPPDSPPGPTPGGPTPGPGGGGAVPSQATETPTPSPTSDRYALLVACPATPDCYRYTVRAGDNLWSIARWFGVPLETVYERNPELRSSTLRPGTEIVLPTPTR